MRKKHIFLWIVLFELVSIVFLAGKIYLDHSQVLGENVSINPIKKNDLIFPEEGNLKYYYEPKPNTNQTYKPDWSPVDYVYAATVNADGLNERFDYPVEKKPDVFRIVTIGDSYTFGGWVNTKENYPERLEDMLNDNSLCKTGRKFEVINLGVEGYDVEYSVHRFKNRGQKYNPDLLIWLIKNDDFTVINELIKYKMDRYMAEIMSDQSLLIQLQGERNFYPWSRKAAQELMAEIGEEGVLAYNRKALERINDHYKGKLVFITFSEKKALKGSRLVMLQSFAKERSDTYIYDGLSLSYDKLEDGAHPTGKGYAQIAGWIFDYLKQNGIVPCDSL